MAQDRSHLTPIADRGDHPTASAALAVQHGIYFTAHALKRMNERRIMPSVATSIIDKCTGVFNYSTAYGATVTYVGKAAKVITNLAGDVITVIPR